jgi:cytochrome b pre-mRNA-processing protein 3
VWNRSKIARRPAVLAAERLHEGAVAAARARELYADLGVPDTTEGRFELLTLHMILLVERLGAAAADDVRQALFDSYVSHLDGAMREMGVADLTMGKRMKRLGEVFYGRAASYREALAALPERGSLEALLARTVFDGVRVSPGPLAGYVVRGHAILAKTSNEDLLAGAAVWPAP